MQIELFDQAVKDERVLLSLVATSEGMELQALSPNGERRYNGTLLTIQPNGSVVRAKKLNKSLGFPVNANGRLHVS